MTRPSKITPSTKLTVMIPLDKRTRLDLYLVSSATGKVPQGAYQRWIVERIDEFFAKMGPLEGSPPQQP